MAYNSEYLDENGYGMCISCRKKIFIHNLESCAICERFVCKDCATYRKQGNPFGYVCKKCLQDLKNK